MSTVSGLSLWIMMFLLRALQSMVIASAFNLAYVESYPLFPLMSRVQICCKIYHSH